MGANIISSDWVHMYMSELTSRIVARTGIPSDRFHLGKIVLQSLKDDPDFVLQIDGATGASETFGSVLKRSVRCAIAMKNMGLRENDVMVIMAPSHLDVTVPYYAALYLGVTIAARDMKMNTYDLTYNFNLLKPKIVFCQSEKVEDISKVVQILGLQTIIVTFDRTPDAVYLSEKLEEYKDVDIFEFKATDIDPAETNAFLFTTSGTTGEPKAVIATHKNMAVTSPYFWSFSKKFPTPCRSVLLTLPFCWITTLCAFLRGPFMKYTRIHITQTMSPQHELEYIEKYKPTFMLASPLSLTALCRLAVREKCDFTCFEVILVGGTNVPTELIEQVKVMAPNTLVRQSYGLSEVAGMALMFVGAPPESCGRPMGCMQYRLVDMETKEDITEPNRQGELWLKGLADFKGYYNNPKATEELFSEDGWLQTGDIMYRDENWNFYFVERMKLVLKAKYGQISPTEVEAVIRQHPGVLHVAVVGLPDPEWGELAVACVVVAPGALLTAAEIHRVVRENLSENKQLRGGVIFMDELLLTSTGKLHRQKLKQIVKDKADELQLQ